MSGKDKWWFLPYFRTFSSMYVWNFLKPLRAKNARTTFSSIATKRNILDFDQNQLTSCPNSGTSYIKWPYVGLQKKLTLGLNQSSAKDFYQTQALVLLPNLKSGIYKSPEVLTLTPFRIKASKKKIAVGFISW